MPTRPILLPLNGRRPADGAEISRARTGQLNKTININVSGKPSLGILVETQDAPKTMLRPKVNKYRLCGVPAIEKRTHTKPIKLRDTFIVRFFAHVREIKPVCVVLAAIHNPYHLLVEDLSGTDFIGVNG